VAGYARVSTEEAEQQSSYQAQVEYYTSYITGREDWELVEVYTDEGITGTSMKPRRGFRQMIADALEGKIDLIITKSISRFARNTVDSLTTIRRLREHGTEVYFEKENIWTFDSRGELLLTILSSLAQEESRSISENIRWGTRKKFADGRYSLNYQHFLGYEKDPEGTLAIHEGQAKTVRRIYGLYLAGFTCQRIASALTQEAVPTPAGKEKWYASTVRRILSNETYKGDKLLQKTYSVDFLHKKRLLNRGQVQQYYVEGDHAPIIPPETFRRVQEELERRKKRPAAGGTIFSARLFCAQCGAVYGRKIWHSASKTRRKGVWQCNGKYRKGLKHPPKTWWELIRGAREKAASEDEGPSPAERGATGKCPSPSLTEEDIRRAFEQVFRGFREDQAEVIQNLKEAINCLDHPGEEGAAPPSEEGNLGRERRKKDIREWIASQEGTAEFSGELWCCMVDYAVVRKDAMVFLLTSGERIAVEL
jgi:DNA invertase Pin-like site-specific DNA recombinase